MATKIVPTCKIIVIMLLNFSLRLKYLIKDGSVPGCGTHEELPGSSKEAEVNNHSTVKYEGPFTYVFYSPTTNAINPSNQRLQVGTPAHQTASLLHLAIFSSQRAKLRHLRIQSSSTLPFLQFPYPPVQPRRQIVPAGYFPYCWGPKRECMLPVLRGCVRRDGCEVSIWASGHGGSHSQHLHRLQFGQKCRTAGRASTCGMRGEGEDAESGPTEYQF